MPVQRGAVVRFKEPKAPKRSVSGHSAEPTEHIPGTWYVIEKAPTGWWLRPSNVAAIAWTGAHQDRMVSGCLQAETRHLELNLSFPA